LLFFICTSCDQFESDVGDNFGEPVLILKADTKGKPFGSTLIRLFINSNAVRVIVACGNIQIMWFVTDFGLRRGAKVTTGREREVCEKARLDGNGPVLS
jgi:hypothetical protein